MQLFSSVSLFWIVVFLHCFKKFWVLLNPMRYVFFRHHILWRWHGALTSLNLLCLLTRLVVLKRAQTPSLFFWKFKIAFEFWKLIQNIWIRNWRFHLHEAKFFENEIVPLKRGHLTHRTNETVLSTKRKFH